MLHWFVKIKNNIKENYKNYLQNEDLKSNATVVDESPCTPSSVSTEAGCDPDYIPSSRTSEVNVNINIPKKMYYLKCYSIFLHI